MRQSCACGTTSASLSVIIAREFLNTMCAKLAQRSRSNLCELRANFVNSVFKSWFIL